MAFSIRMGVPEMELFWNDLTKKADKGSLSKTEQKLFKKLVKAFGFLSQNPRHPGLSSHEISDLSRRYGMKVWESYLENNTPSAGRIFWVYGPDQKDITIIGIEPHPEDKKRGGYDKVKLSELN
ncbi:hypothetical protein [Spirochaeta isovalerica]|uniref:Uncharacterized protein n=1 Tax=Spirochaeta isovalerica TaxID=150 RepID=A0A841RAF1_9SPIO|nr:hypothetical protein [Spirochaeta isovalerica]MBB6480893.1 hypothetical protein [Spirochaeta isovalerica]MBB6480905.1 hypothetical protein [Spirochaeta isovalerica]